MPASQTCLDPEVLAAFLDGALPAPAREEVMAHLVRCEACYEVYAGAVAFQLEEAEAGQEAHKVKAATTGPTVEAEGSQETQSVEAAQTDPAEEAGLTRTPFWRADASRPSSAPGPPAGSRSARPVRTEPTPAAVPTRDWDPAALSDLLQVIAAEPWPGDLGEKSPRRGSAPSAPSAPSAWMRWVPAFAAALLVGLAGPLYFALRPPSLPDFLQARVLTSSIEPRLHGLKTLKELESPDHISLGPGSRAPRTAARLGVLLARLRMALVAEDGPHASDIARGIVALSLSAGPLLSAGTAGGPEALRVYRDLEQRAGAARIDEAYRTQAAEAEMKIEGAVTEPALRTLMDLGKWAEASRVAADLGDAGLLKRPESAAFLRRVLEKPPPTLGQRDLDLLKELRRQIGRGQPDLPETKNGLDKLIKSMTAPPPPATGLSLSSSPRSPSLPLGRDSGRLLPRPAVTARLAEIVPSGSAARVRPADPVPARRSAERSPRV